MDFRRDVTYGTGGVSGFGREPWDIRMGGASYMRFSKMLGGAFGLASVLLSTTAVNAMSLREAVQEALVSNPQVLQAIENREAIEFELRQAKGLFLPTIDLDASIGTRRLDSPSRRRVGEEGDTLYPSDVGVTLNQTLFDGGGRRAEVDRQASRVDGASFRVLERSEGVALKVVQEYLEVLLQAEIVAETRNNLGFHQQIVNDIGQSVSGGAMTSADAMQARERLLAARARHAEASEDLEAAKIRFMTLVGKPIGKPQYPGSVSRALPASLQAAIDIARARNPRLAAAGADVDTADALVRSARSDYLPTVALQGRARYGDDTDGSEGRSADLEAKVVARWNLYRGGQTVAKEQEHIRRASEQRQALHQAHRETEESIRIAWDRRAKRAELAATLKQQASANAQLVSSYREQLNVGQRSLLDVLDAQNTRYNAAVMAKTSQYAALFEEYRILAATGGLARTMGAATAEQGQAYAREEFKVIQQADPQYKRTPSRQVKDLPLDLLAPVRN